MRITLWRLYRRAHGDGFDGAGGLYAEGRWHKLGSRVVYCGATPSIVVLERLAHLDPDMLPGDLILGRFAADVTVEQLSGPVDIHDLAQTQARGAAFLKGMTACVLAVPSVLVPEDSNYVINPAHPQATSIRLLETREFKFNARLL